MGRQNKSLTYQLTQTTNPMSSPSYDVIIVGAGIAGCALAHALSTLPRPKPLRIALIERSLSEPDRIVGELLQPGGVIALKRLGMEACLEGIDAIPVKGYCVVEGGKSVHIPYPATYEGRSFHHGRFIMKLREAASKAEGVEMIEATVTDLVQADSSRRITGVTISRKSEVDSQSFKESLFADIVIVADGCFSNFRNVVMGVAAVKASTKSHFIGAILEDARLPIPNHGTVALVKGFGPVLLYQISEHDTRILVDVKLPLPSDLKVRHINIHNSRLTLFTHVSRIYLKMSSLNYRQPFIYPSKKRLKKIDYDECQTLSFLPSSKVHPLQSRV